MSHKPDQADVLAQLETLRGEHTAAAANVTKLTADLAAANAIAARVPNLEANLQSITQERDALKAENTRLAGESRDFNARVTAELAKLGIRPQGASAPKREANESAEGEAIVAQYNAITDPIARTKFAADNFEKLRKFIR